MRCTFAKKRKHIIPQQSSFYLLLPPPPSYPIPPHTTSQKKPPTSRTSLHTHAPTPPNLRHSLTQRLAHFPAAHHPREPPLHHLVLLLLGFAVAVRGDEGMGRGPAFLDRNGFVAREASGCHCGDRACFSVFSVFLIVVFVIFK